MREVLGAGRGVQAGEVETPAMVAEARRARKSEEEGGGGDGAQDSERVRNTYKITKPQGFIIRPPLTTNKILSRSL